jgi:hypothetical protein
MGSFLLCFGIFVLLCWFLPYIFEFSLRSRIQLRVFLSFCGRGCLIAGEDRVQRMCVVSILPGIVVLRIGLGTIALVVSIDAARGVGWDWNVVRQAAIKCEINLLLLILFDCTRTAIRMPAITDWHPRADWAISTI